MDARSDATLHAYYARGEERDRLAQARGLVEFERTKELVLGRAATACGWPDAATGSSTAT